MLKKCTFVAIFVHIYIYIYVYAHQIVCMSFRCFVGSVASQDRFPPPRDIIAIYLQSGALQKRASLGAMKIDIKIHWNVTNQLKKQTWDMDDDYERVMGKSWKMDHDHEKDDNI